MNLNDEIRNHAKLFVRDAELFADTLDDLSIQYTKLQQSIENKPTESKILSKIAQKLPSGALSRYIEDVPVTRMNPQFSQNMSDNFALLALLASTLRQSFEGLQAATDILLSRGNAEECFLVAALTDGFARQLCMVETVVARVALETSADDLSHGSTILRLFPFVPDILLEELQKK